MSASFLSQIIDAKKRDIEGMYKSTGLEAFKKSAEGRGESPFYNALKQPGLSLIAELKKASPSKGVIRETFNPLSLAKSFESKGAAALSILTEETAFLGKPDYIALVKKDVQLPVIRKDFILDEIQVYESKCLGADAILLIKAILDVDKLQQLLNTADKCGLDVLVEFHDEEEVSIAGELKRARIFGVNNRNLKTFEVDVQSAQRLYPRLRELSGETAALVAESGYQSRSQLDGLLKTGFDAVLIGEGLALNPNL